MPSKDNPNSSLPLPADSMPECWSRDERMNALFAEFRNRSVNSQDWDSKYKFWENLIAEWLAHNQRCVFSVADLKVAFKRNGRTPLCLVTVVEELLRNGEIISEAEFLRESSGTWTGWAIDTMVKKPVVWSFSKLRNYLVRSVIDVEARYVHLRTTKQLGSLILSTISDENDNVIVSLGQLTRDCVAKSGKADITEESVKLALLWLRSAKKASFRGDSANERAELLINVSRSAAREVSEAEVGLFKLAEQERLIIGNIEKLEIERNAIVARARKFLAEGLREMAKTCLRKKKEVEASIEKRSVALHNVQTLIARIHEAKTNTEILAAYKTGSEILRSFESGALNEENVVSTMDSMSEAVGEIADLQAFMSTSIGTSDSDLDLEEELRDLLDSSPSESNARGDSRAKPKLPDIDDLPDLQRELSALDLEDIPQAAKSSARANPSDRKPEKDCPA